MTLAERLKELADTLDMKAKEIKDRTQRSDVNVNRRKYKTKSK